MGKVGYTRERKKNLTGQSYDTNCFQDFPLADTDCTLVSLVFMSQTEHFIADMILYQEELRTVNVSYMNKFYLNEHQFNAEKNILFLG